MEPRTCKKGVFGLLEYPPLPIHLAILAICSIYAIRRRKALSAFNFLYLKRVNRSRYLGSKRPLSLLHYLVPSLLLSNLHTAGKGKTFPPNLPVSSPPSFRPPSPKTPIQ